MDLCLKKIFFLLMWICVNIFIITFILVVPITGDIVCYTSDFYLPCYTVLVVCYAIGLGFIIAFTKYTNFLVTGPIDNWILSGIYGVEELPSRQRSLQSTACVWDLQQPSSDETPVTSDIELEEVSSADFLILDSPSDSLIYNA